MFARHVTASVSLLMLASAAHAQWSLNGAKVFYNGGNVGIGTNNPGYPLEVRGAGTRTVFGLNTAGSGTHYGIWAQANSPAGGALYALANATTGTNYAVIGKTNSDSGYASWFIGGKNYFSGRVGIGGSNPTQKLQVVGNVKATGWFGTDANAPVELRSKNTPVFRAQYAADAFSTAPNIIGGYAMNSVDAGVTGATIAGGGFNLAGLDFPNEVDGSYGTIGGGGDNLSSGQSATIAGGLSNTASGDSSTVGGGNTNVASGISACVPGGANNNAVGDYSFAAGYRAKANHIGSFVLADSTNTDLATTGNNQFIVRASGGMYLGADSSPSIPMTDFINTSTGAHLTAGGTWTNASSRDLKENFAAINPIDVLNHVVAMPISRWNYKVEGSKFTHMGPTSQDFSAAFGLGTDQRSIATVDADGVSLAAIQGLHQLVQQKESEIAQLRAEKDAQIKALNERLARLESLLSNSAAAPK